MDVQRILSFFGPPKTGFATSNILDIGLELLFLSIFSICMGLLPAIEHRPYEMKNDLASYFLVPSSQLNLYPY